MRASVLDDPMETVEKLAPYTFNVHFKDMAVSETATGFQMSEVPLGDGILDLKAMVDTIRRAKPDVYFSLEMITRGPLEIPCVTDKYWATFGDVCGLALARALTRVRGEHRSHAHRGVDGVGGLRPPSAGGAHGGGIRDGVILHGVDSAHHT